MRFSSLALAFLLGVSFFGTSCSKPKSRTTTPTVVVDAGDFDRAALLNALGTCAVGTYKSFETTAQQLVAATEKLASDRSEANVKAARDAYLASADAWQEAELMQFGPLGATSLPGGQGLRDAFYAWPLLGRCQTDRNIANKTYESPDFTKTGVVTSRGLGALEYLLFVDVDGNSCGSSEDINVNGTWAAMSKEELAARRAAYANVLAKDLVAKTGELVSTWEKGGYLQTFATAGSGSTVYKTVEDALNSVTDALFYIYFMSRDRKLGAPLGIDMTLCAEGPCGELVESQYSKRSVQALRRNLVAYRKLIEGCGPDFGGLGFDDYLTAVGAGTLANEMKGDVTAAIAAVDAYPYATIDEGLAKDVPAVQKLYDALKAVTDALKVDFAGVLKLQIPARVGGDTD